MDQQFKTKYTNITQSTHLWTKRHGELLYGFAELNRSLSVHYQGEKIKKGRGREGGMHALNLVNAQ